MKKIFFLTIGLLIQICLFSQNKEISDTDKKTEYWGDLDGFLNQQAKVSLGITIDFNKGQNKSGKRQISPCRNLPQVIT